MYISCPECNSKFAITQEQIGEHGRKVKCSKCENIWFQEPIKIDKKKQHKNHAVLVHEYDSDKGVNLPALLPVKISPYLYTLPLLLTGLIMLMLVILFPQKIGLESLLDNKNLSVKNIIIDNNKELNKITVSYKIHNSSNNSVNMPLVRIRLIDKNGRVVKSLVDNHPKIILSPDQLVELKAEFVPVPTLVEAVDVMIGNKLDFLLR